MPRYPEKQRSQYRGPGWTVAPPSAGGYLAGAGANLNERAKSFAGLSATIAAFGAEVGAAVSKENIIKAQNFVKENEPQFRKLEREGKLDWTPPMMQGAWETSGNLNGQEFLNQYNVKMNQLTTEELQDIEAPERIYNEMLDTHLDTDTRRNTWFDDGFNNIVVDQGKPIVGRWTTEAAKAKKKQAIYDIGLETSNIVISQLKRLDGLDPSAPLYDSERASVVEVVLRDLGIRVNGTGDVSDSGHLGTGWFGAGLWTGDNNLGAMTVLKQVLSAVSNGEYDPQIGVDIIQQLPVGEHKFSGIIEVQQVLSEFKKGLPELRASWETRKRAGFWRNQSSSLHGASLIFESFQNNLKTKADSDTSLYEWLKKGSKDLHTHFGLEMPDEDTLVDSDGNVRWAFSDKKMFNAQAKKIQEKYIQVKNQLATQQQLHATIAPTVAELDALMAGASEAAEGVGSGLIFGVPADPSATPPIEEKFGLLAGARNDPASAYTLFDTTAARMATMWDPASYRTNPKGKRFGEEGAKRWLADYLHQTLYVNEPDPAVQATFALTLGTQNTYVQENLAKTIARAAGQLNLYRAVGRAGSPMDLDPLDRIHEGTMQSLVTELPKDPGEIAPEDLVGSPIEKSFIIFEHIRESGPEITNKVLGIKGTSISSVFENAWAIRGNGAPAAARLAQASTRIRISDLGGGLDPRPLTTKAKRLMVDNIKDLDKYTAGIVSEILMLQYESFDPGTWSDDAATGLITEWGEKYVKTVDGVFTRIGPPEGFYTEDIPEEKFFERFKQDIEDQSTMDIHPDESVQFTVFRLSGQTQIIPHVVNAKTGERKDLFGTNIKALYSGDDIQYLMEAYNAEQKYNEREERDDLVRRSSFAHRSVIGTFLDPDIVNYWEEEEVMPTPIGGYMGVGETVPLDIAGTLPRETKVIESYFQGDEPVTEVVQDVSDPTITASTYLIEGEELRTADVMQRAAAGEVLAGEDLMVWGMEETRRASLGEIKKEHALKELEKQGVNSEAVIKATEAALVAREREAFDFLGRKGDAALQRRAKKKIDEMVLKGEVSREDADTWVTNTTKDARASAVKRWERAETELNDYREFWYEGGFEREAEVSEAGFMYETAWETTREFIEKDESDSRGRGIREDTTEALDLYRGTYATIYNKGGIPALEKEITRLNAEVGTPEGVFSDARRKLLVLMNLVEELKKLDPREEK